MRLPVPDQVSRTISVYSAYTGADGQFEFFAPDVGTQLRAQFDVMGNNGQITTHTLEKKNNSEADLRVGNMINVFWAQGFDQKVQRSIAASWAGKMFGRYPFAKEVVVRIQEYHLPSMDEFKRGNRPYWKDYYIAKFSTTSKG